MENAKIRHRTFYFMSGLPRAGSTLISSILNQNPRIHSGPSSPVVPTMLALENSLSNDELFLAYPKYDVGKQIISNILLQYYMDVDKPVIIDKNRSWVNRMHYISGYFGIEAKILCPVRNIDEILASFISMQRRNTFTSNNTKINFLDEMLIKSNVPLTDENRCNFLIDGNMGILGQSYNGIKKALMEGHQKKLHFIEYDDLINRPEETMRSIYDFLEEDYYAHTFDNIVNQHRENDAQIYGMADMHEVRSTLSRRGINPKEILSDEILVKCKNAEFWRDIEDMPSDEMIPLSNDLSNSSFASSNIIGE